MTNQALQLTSRSMTVWRPQIQVAPRHFPLWPDLMLANRDSKVGEKKKKWGQVLWCSCEKKGRPRWFGFGFGRNLFRPDFRLWTGSLKDRQCNGVISIYCRCDVGSQVGFFLILAILGVRTELGDFGIFLLFQ